MNADMKVNPARSVATSLPPWLQISCTVREMKVSVGILVPRRTFLLAQKRSSARLELSATKSLAIAKRMPYANKANSSAVSTKFQIGTPPSSSFTDMLKSEETKDSGMKMKANSVNYSARTTEVSNALGAISVELHSPSSPS